MMYINCTPERMMYINLIGWRMIITFKIISSRFVSFVLVGIIKLKSLNINKIFKNCVFSTCENYKNSLWS